MKEREMKKGRLMVGRLKGETEGERKKKTEGKKEGGRGWRDMDSFFRHHSQFRPTYDPEGVFSDLMIVLCGTVGSLMALILYTSVQWWYMVVHGGIWWYMVVRVSTRISIQKYTSEKST